MKRSVLFWLVVAVAFWGWMFASNSRQADLAYVFSAMLGIIVAIGLLGFHIIRARRDR
ncbi:MAG: hypothetical protein MIK27_13940 [Sphingomonas sanguinis]|jgi:hypothetical protein|uniref:Uncharacterized protein n=1 Tax=Sphingomonas sanguinis TaxID=33051 RepID=A0ABX1UKE1_9SPHN|nr:hypothetical protein [Sphingomonas sanguinis]NNG49711.1 hypothetical protein [Sphingomonas sanguinis]NNG54609.1 hypothetical protein [Sphingomonas sanguinis]